MSISGGWLPEATASVVEEVYSGFDVGAAAPILISSLAPAPATLSGGPDGPSSMSVGTPGGGGFGSPARATMGDASPLTVDTSPHGSPGGVIVGATRSVPMTGHFSDAHVLHHLRRELGATINLHRPRSRGRQRGGGSSNSGGVIGRGGGGGGGGGDGGGATHRSGGGGGLHGGVGADGSSFSVYGDLTASMYPGGSVASSARHGASGVLSPTAAMDPAFSPTSASASSASSSHGQPIVRPGTGRTRHAHGGSADAHGSRVTYVEEDSGIPVGAPELRRGRNPALPPRQPLHEKQPPAAPQRSRNPFRFGTSASNAFLRSVVAQERLAAKRWEQESKVRPPKPSQPRRGERARRIEEIVRQQRQSGAPPPKLTKVPDDDPRLAAFFSAQQPASVPRHASRVGLPGVRTMTPEQVGAGVIVDKRGDSVVLPARPGTGRREFRTASTMTPTTVAATTGALSGVSAGDPGVVAAGGGGSSGDECAKDGGDAPLYYDEFGYPVPLRERKRRRSARRASEASRASVGEQPGPASDGKTGDAPRSHTSGSAPAASAGGVSSSTAAGHAGDPPRTQAESAAKAGPRRSASSGGSNPPMRRVGSGYGRDASRHHVINDTKSKLAPPDVADVKRHSGYADSWRSQYRWGVGPAAQTFNELLSEMEADKVAFDANEDVYTHSGFLTDSMYTHSAMPVLAGGGGGGGQGGARTHGGGGGSAWRPGTAPSPVSAGARAGSVGGSGGGLTRAQLARQRSWRSTGGNRRPQSRGFDLNVGSFYGGGGGTFVSPSVGFAAAAAGGDNGTTIGGGADAGGDYGGGGAADGPAAIPSRPRFTFADGAAGFDFRHVGGKMPPVFPAANADAAASSMAHPVMVQIRPGTDGRELVPPRGTYTLAARDAGAMARKPRPHEVGASPRQSGSAVGGGAGAPQGKTQRLRPTTNERQHKAAQQQQQQQSQQGAAVELLAGAGLSGWDDASGAP